MKAVLVPCVLLATVTLWADGDEGARTRGHFLTPRELAELGEKSDVKYATTIVKDGSELPAFRHPAFPKDEESRSTPYPQISRGPGGSRSLLSYRPSEVAQKALEDAEPLYQAQKYTQALPIYREASLKDPKCYVLYMSIGDCYLFSGNPVAALDNYDKAIALNPDDFHGHWFRATALVELGKPDEARHAYARALAMSPRNPSLLKAINARADRLGFRAREELFHPRAMARPEGDTFVIYTVEGLHWWIYGLCKAVWLAEEGHRKDLTGKTEHNWTNTEELECLANLVARYGTDREVEKDPAEPELDLLSEVLDSGHLGSFVNYEFGSQVTADYTILIDDESLEKLSRFVELFVFLPVSSSPSPSPSPDAPINVTEAKRGACQPEELQSDRGCMRPPTRTRNVSPTYPKRALRRREEGSVSLTVTVDPTGKITDVVVSGSLPKNLDFEEAAMAAVRQWQYEPGLLAGKPVTVVFTVRVDFSMSR